MDKENPLSYFQWLGVKLCLTLVDTIYSATVYLPQV